MNKALVYASGVVTGLGILFVLGWFLVGTKEPGGANTGVLREVRVLGDDAFVLSGTVAASEKTSAIVKSGAGRLAMAFLTGPAGKTGILAQPEEIHPQFPRKFEIVLSKDELSRNPDIKDGISLAAVYATSDVSRKAYSYVYFEPSVFGQVILPFTEKQIREKNLPKRYDVGKVPLTAFVAQTISTSCLSEKVLLAGTIEPTPGFLKSAAENKFMFFVSAGPTYKLAPGEEGEKAIVYRQWLDVSRGKMEFSVPFVRARSPFLHVLGVRCEAGDTLDTCQHRAFPFQPFRERSRHRYYVRPATGEVPFCGMVGFRGTIDQPESIFPDSLPVPFDQRPAAAGSAP